MIEHVSDTARWVAVYRARETKRPDALFKDPLAEKLAGPAGHLIAKKATAGQWVEWSVVIRTVIIDEFINELVKRGIDTIVNLGAGLDTRPYRMNLPAGLRWIEVDYPVMIDLKNQELAEQMPNCRLERVKLDLSDLPAREKFFNEVNGQSKNTLVMTEGVLPYLTPDQVSSLAADIRKQSNFRQWIVDYSSPQVQKYLRNARTQKQMKNAPFQFFVEDWFGFFEKLGWKVRDIRYLGETAMRNNRTPPFPWFIRLLMKIAKPKDQKPLRFSAYVILEPK